MDKKNFATRQKNSRSSEGGEEKNSDETGLSRGGGNGNSNKGKNKKLKTSKRQGDRTEDLVGRTITWREQPQQEYQQFQSNVDRRSDVDNQRTTISSNSRGVAGTEPKSSPTGANPPTLAQQQSNARTQDQQATPALANQTPQQSENLQQNPNGTQDIQLLQQLMGQVRTQHPGNPTPQQTVPPELVQAMMLSQFNQHQNVAAFPPTPQNDPSLQQLLLQTIMSAGNLSGNVQAQLLQAVTQQQQPPTATTAPEMSSAVLQAALAALPSLAQTQQVQQYVLQLCHQVEQERRQQEQLNQQQQQQEQVAALIGLLLPQLQQPQTNSGLAQQLGSLQQLLSVQSTTSSTAQHNLSAALLQLIVMGQQQQQQGRRPLPTVSTPSSLSEQSSDPAALLQLLASTSTEMPRLPAPGNSSAQEEGGANLTRGISNLSSGRSAINQPAKPTMKRKSHPGSGNIGRPSNTFEDREPSGRARNLPTLLVMPSDLVELSAHQTLLRYQIEVFRAGDEDVATHTRGRNKPVERGQIGVRCRHCKVLPIAERLRGSVYFPRAIEGFYQAAQNMNSTHLQTGECQMMGNELREEFADLISSRGTSTGAGRAYWAQQARNLGLENTDDGIRFYTDPPEDAKTEEKQEESSK